MARRRDQDRVLQQIPWWVFLALAPLAYLAMTSVLPRVLAPRGRQSALVAPMLDAMLWPAGVFVASMLVLTAAQVWYRQARSRRLLDRQSDIASIRALGWRELERLVAEAYRRQGYAVIETGGRGPDGGVDVVIEKDGTHLVQCKHWKAYTVGVKEARELFGIVAAEKADGGILVTCGDFTQEARAFAAGTRMQLVDGPRLVELVKSAQGGAPAGLAGPQPAAPDRSCPRCGRPMVVRTARRGANTGGRFLGCSGFPACRATEQLPD